MNPQPPAPSSDLRPRRTSVPFSECSRSSHPTSAATPAHSWTEDETVGSLQDLEGFHGGLWTAPPWVCASQERERTKAHGGPAAAQRWRIPSPRIPGAQPRSLQRPLDPLTQPRLIAGLGVTPAACLCLGGFHQTKFPLPAQPHGPLEVQNLPAASHWARFLTPALRVTHAWPS